MIKFRILGPLEARTPGQAVRIGGERQRKLLALLLLNANRTVPVDQLVDELWEDPPQSVRQQVHNAVAGLRRTLADTPEGPQITRTDSGYRLEIDEDALDLHRFAQLAEQSERAEGRGDLGEAARLLGEALGIWRGAALSGLHGTMITNAAARLDEQRLTALERLMSLRVRTGGAAAVVGELRELVAEHPLREPLRAVLMEALYLSGRQADALAVYDEGRRQLAEELGLDPSPALQQVHNGVLTGSLGSTVSVPVAAPVEAPSYLPHDIRDFSGRDAEMLDVLDEVRRSRGRTLVVSAVDGMGGVGKTAFAVHLAHRVADDYPDGHYFIDLHGFSQGVEPVTPEQALDVLLRDSGVAPESVPSTLDARSALWRSRLAGAKALVVLDNARDVAQVRPLLPGAGGSFVIITSRHRLTSLDAAVPLSLDVLPLDDAVRLFTEVAGERRVEGQDVRAAVELCGRLPLAIRIAAARLRSRSAWTVEELCSRLGAADRRAALLRTGDRDVFAAIELSYQTLPSAQQRAFRLLGLHPGGDFDAFTAAAIIGCSPDEAEEWLEGLVDDNLLRQQDSGRYYFHDLVRDCARRLVADADDQELVTRRLLDHYLVSAHRWCAPFGHNLHPVEPDVDHLPAHVSPASVLASEEANLVAVAQFAAGFSPAHAWQLAAVTVPMFARRNYGGSAHDLLTAGVAAARAVGDVRGECLCLHGLALTAAYRASFDEAAEHVASGVALARQLGDTDRECLLLIVLGGVRITRDDWEGAREALSTAAAVASEDTPVVARGTIANNLGLIALETGDLDEAASQLQHAMAVLGPDDPFRMYDMAAVNLGFVHLALGELDKAESAFRGVLDGSVRGQAEALAGLSSVYRARSRFVESLDHGHHALSLAREYSMPVVEADVLSCLGETSVSAGDLDAAERFFTDAAAIARDRSSARREARALEGLAHVAAAREDETEARRLREEALALYPASSVKATYVQRHLDGEASCFRCAVE